MTPGWRTFLSITDNFITIITTIQNHRQQLAQQHLYHQLSSHIRDLGLSEPKRRLKRGTDRCWYCLIAHVWRFSPHGCLLYWVLICFWRKHGVPMNLQHWSCLYSMPLSFFCGHATFDPLPKIKRITQIDQCLTHTPRLLWLEIGDEGLEQSYPCVNWSKHILISPISSCIPMITGVSTCPTWTSPNKTGDIVSVSNRYFSSDVKQISKTSKTRHGNQPLFDYLFIIYMCIYI